MSSAPFAIIASGGRQYRVEPGELVRMDRMAAPAGDEVTFDKVLLLGTGEQVKVGTPHVPGAAVKGRVVREFRDSKVLVFRKIKTKQFRKTRGHREYYTLVKIEAIEPGQ